MPMKMRPTGRESVSNEDQQSLEIREPSLFEAPFPEANAAEYPYAGAPGAAPLSMYEAEMLKRQQSMGGGQLGLQMPSQEFMQDGENGTIVKIPSLDDPYDFLSANKQQINEFKMLERN